MVARARAIAERVHEGQTDKAGADYIDHPRRVAERLEESDLRAAAWLHDVLEDDDDWSAERLREEGIPDRIIEIVEVLTKRSGECYEDAVRRAASHPRARLVKAADVADNSDPERLARLGEVDPGKAAELREKYGYPELTETAKRKILGLNSVPLYGITQVDHDAYRPVPEDYESRMTDELKTVLEVGQLPEDNMSQMKETYRSLAIQPDHRRYGWIRVHA